MRERLDRRHDSVMTFLDRREAARALGAKVASSEGRSDPTMPGVPRGGVPMAVPEMPGYLERFSRGHEGWLAHLEVEGEPPTGEAEIGEQPLNGIVADTAQNRLLVFLENAARGSTHYCIDQPTEIWQRRSGKTLRLEVDSADGSTTVLECHPAGH